MPMAEFCGRVPSNTSERFCMELFRHTALVILSSKMLTESQNTGYKAEENALSFLARQGLKVVERNFRCRFGEIDLIMRDGDVLVFVEVRKRKNGFFGGALASISMAKQRRLVSTARYYLSRTSFLPSCRFDVVAFDGNECRWLKNVIEVE